MKILDLFCGAGGLSIGFEKAGFEVIKAYDFSEYAIQTYNENRINKVAEVKDITTLKKEEIKKIGHIDGIIGGPPCQGFSTAGQRIIDDERNKLYRHYFNAIEILEPTFFVIENVTGILNFSKGLVKEDIEKRAEDLGYILFLDTLDSSKYGVPQIRKRVFFVAIKKELVNHKYVFPGPEDKIVTVYDAIGDLPSLDNHEPMEYIKECDNDFLKLVRGNNKIIFNHQQSNHTKKTIEKISLVPEGGSIKDLPIELTKDHNYNALFRRMDSRKPSLTIDTGHRTYFHYKENRVPSVRECARIQSFDDCYIFYGPKSEQYKQVGNAVPPILAYKLALSIIQFLEDK